MELNLDAGSLPLAPRRPGAMKGQIHIAEDFDTTSPELIALFFGEDSDEYGMSIDTRR